MQFKAVLFDLSDTLILLDYSGYANLLNKKFGLSLGKKDIIELEGFARQQIDRYVLTRGLIQDLKTFWEIYYQAVFDFLKTTKGVDEEKLRRSLPEIFKEIPRLWNRLNPEIYKFLEGVGENLRLGVLSNGPTERAKEKLKSFGILEKFEFIIGSDITGTLKPDVEAFKKAVSLLKLKENQVIYVGDYFSLDYLGAMNAGLKAVLYDPYGQYPEGPEKIKSLEELLELLQ